jgi:hypothetical protein
MTTLAMSSGSTGLMVPPVSVPAMSGVGERRHDHRDVDAVRRDLVGQRGGHPDDAELGADVDHCWTELQLADGTVEAVDAVAD